MSSHHTVHKNAQKQTTARLRKPLAYGSATFGQ